jgi:hypothetical protein
MGFKKVPTIYTLTFEGTDWEGLEARMSSTSFGTVRRLFRMLNDDSSDNELESVEGIVNLLAKNLVSWNLEDDNGPVPADESGLDDQEFPFIMELSNRYLDQITGVVGDLGKDSTSGEKFPGQLPTMEAL